jgi:hypothetical protein
MKKLISCLFLLSLFTVSFAQENTSKWQMNVSWSYSWFFKDSKIMQINSKGLIYDLNTLPWSPLGIGMQRTGSKDVLIGFGITNLNFDLGTSRYVSDTAGNPVSEFESKSLLTSFYFELSKEILKKKENHKRYIGLGIYPDIGYHTFEHAPSFDFPTSCFYTGFNLAFVPSTVSRLNDRFSLMLSLPVSLFHLNYSRGKIEDPSLPPASKITSLIDIKTFPLYIRPTLALIF